MISLRKPDDVYHVVGRGSVFVFDTRTQPNAGKLQRGDFFTSAGRKYQVVAIERTTYLTSPVTYDPKVGIIVREIFKD